MSDLAKDVTLWKHSSAETAKLWVKFHKAIFPLFLTNFDLNLPRTPGTLK